MIVEMVGRKKPSVLLATSHESHQSFLFWKKSWGGDRESEGHPHPRKWGHTRPKGISPKMVGLVGLVGPNQQNRGEVVGRETEMVGRKTRKAAHGQPKRV